MNTVYDRFILIFSDGYYGCSLQQFLKRFNFVKREAKDKQALIYLLQLQDNHKLYQKKVIPEESKL